MLLDTIKPDLLPGYGELCSLKVTRPQPNLKVGLKHAVPAYLNEWYPVTIEIKNEERDSVRVMIDVEVKVPEGGGAFRRYADRSFLSED